MEIFKEVYEDNIKGNVMNLVRNIFRASKTENYKSVLNFDI